MTNMDPRLVDWFADEEDEGDAPELHLVGLRPGDLERSFAVLVELGARWSDRTFHIDDEEIDVTVPERPEVAALVAAGRVTRPCLGAAGIAVDGVELPLVEMFLSPEEIEFFWWPDPEWSTERVAAFFALLARLLALAPQAMLRVDPRYQPSSRRELGDLIAPLVGDRVEDGRS